MNIVDIKNVPKDYTDHIKFKHVVGRRGHKRCAGRGIIGFDTNTHEPMLCGCAKVDLDVIIFDFETSKLITETENKIDNVVASSSDRTIESKS